MNTFAIVSGIVSVYLLLNVVTAMTPDGSDHYDVISKMPTLLDTNSDATAVAIVGLTGIGAYLAAAEHVLHEHSVNAAIAN